MKQIKIFALLSLIFLALQSASAWEVKVKIKEGECQGEYLPAQSLKKSARYLLTSANKTCAEKLSLIYQQEKQKENQLYFFGLSYQAESPPGAENGIVLNLIPPRAEKIMGARVSFIYWTEPFYRPGFKRLPKDIQFLLWQEPEGKYGAMIPLVGSGYRSIIQGAGQEIEVCASSYVSDFIPKEPVPMLAVALGKDPYQLIPELYKYGMEKMGNPGKLRWEKPYPEIFEYIGWCSWNAHYTKIDEKKLLAHARSYKEKGFPIGFFLIDDGWLSVGPTSAFLISHASYLTDFKADPKKFPQGLAHTVGELKKLGVKYVGVWHTFQGYWSGVLNDSELARKEKSALFPYSEKGSIPHPLEGKGEKFYRDWYHFLTGAGINFVKVDNQSTMSSLVKDKIPISYAMAGEQRNLQRAAGDYFNYNVINCMEMNIDVVYHWWGTNIGRTSTDYNPEFPLSLNNPRAHIHKNIMNALWFSNLSYPDYDMFQTHNIGAVMHALARAISGGPIYTTDKAGKEKLEVLYPLIFSDGKILRPDQPALPCRDSLFGDPRFQTKALKAFTRVGKSGILAGFNVNYFSLPVSFTYSPKDVEGLKGEKFASYEHFSREKKVMSLSEQGKMRIPPYQAGLWIFSPIEKGFASIGLVDKYLSPRAVLSENISRKKAQIQLYEAGKFLAYCQREVKEILVGKKLLSPKRVKFENNWLELDLSDFPAKPLKIIILFKE